MRRAQRTIVLFFLAPIALRAQAVPGSRVTTSRPVAQAIRRDGEIVLDGRLSEPAWKKSRVVSGFTQSYPSPGSRPIDSTEVSLLYDDAAVYVGIRMFDAHPDSIASQ